MRIDKDNCAERSIDLLVVIIYMLCRVIQSWCLCNDVPFYTVSISVCPFLLCFHHSSVVFLTFVASCNLFILVKKGMEDVDFRVKRL